MKVAALLLCFAAAAWAQESNIESVFRQAIGNFGRQFRPGQPQRRPSNRPNRPNRLPARQQAAGSNNVDTVWNGKGYNFSWRHTASKWDWDGARAYCDRLGSGWKMISVGSRAEDEFADNAIDRENVPYIWTSLFLSGGAWRWAEDNPGYIDWSETGGFRTRQPDNREFRQGGGPHEARGSILNKFYQRDGITMHDVAPYHRKPTICETHLS